MMDERKWLSALIERYPQLEICEKSIWNVYQILCMSFKEGGKLLIAGNGGSAADAEHIVGELMKGFVKKRALEKSEKAAIMELNPEMGERLCKYLQKALPAIALSGHVALSTAYMNDMDGSFGFAQQAYGYGKKGDVLLGITTSGNSENVLYAVLAAKAKGLKTVALTGQSGGRIKEMADQAIMVPETEAYKVQELHLPIYHTLCLMLEETFY